MQNRLLASVRRPRVLRSTEIEMYGKDPCRVLTLAELRERSDPDSGRTVLPRYRPAPYGQQLAVLKAEMVDGHPGIQPLAYRQPKKARYSETSCPLLAAPSSTP